MALKLMYITNNPKIAKIAENAGVDWIFIDLEINGKEMRQGHLDTVISKHSIEDINSVKKVLTKAKLLVRVNPIFEGSKQEIDMAINNGADIIMLPFFKTVDEVKLFLNIVNKRAKACLLLETPKAVEEIDRILEVSGIDMIHIGLNDLHLGYHMDFMFEPLANDLVEKIGKKIIDKKVMFGFGGIAQLGQGMLPAEKIIAEHYRLGSTMVILSRTFCDIKKIDDTAKVEYIFKKGINKIRDFEVFLQNKNFKYFNENKQVVNKTVQDIVKCIRENNK